MQRETLTAVKEFSNQSKIEVVEENDKAIGVLFPAVHTSPVGEELLQKFAAEIEGVTGFLEGGDFGVRVPAAAFHKKFGL